MSQRHARRHSYVPPVSASAAESTPPAYQSASREHGTSRRHSQQPLPAYAQAVALNLQVSGNDARHGGPSLQHHEFYLVKGDGHGVDSTWATLKVTSRESTSSQKIPKFFGGDSITGTLELDLDRPRTINSITLSLRGRFITGFLEEGAFTFLNQVVTIWDKNAGDPRMPHPSPLDFDGSKKTKFNAKLEGSYSWPFSLHFPTEVIIPNRSGSQQRVVQTPQSFLERGVSANIQYQLVMHITHGLFRPNSKLQVIIQYTPSLSPAPASFLRQQAYIQGGFLFPPSEDPTGWHSLPEKCFKHSNPSLDVQLSLSLAEPLSYTRGTVIPCFLILSNNTPSSDVDLLSLLLSPTRPFFELQLQRKINHIQDASQTVGSTASGTGTKAIPIKSSEMLIGKASWWKPASMNLAQSDDRCYLEGEIHLPGELSPSCNVGFLVLEYIISLIAHLGPTSKSLPSSSGPGRSFRSNPSTSTQPSHSLDTLPVLSCPIEITTFHVHGPLPTPFMTGPQRHNNEAFALAKRESRSNIRYEDILGTMQTLFSGPTI